MRDDKIQLATEAQRHREGELEPQLNTVQVNVNVVAPRLALEEPNVYSHGQQSDDPAPEEQNVPAMSKSSTNISLLRSSGLWVTFRVYKHSAPPELTRLVAANGCAVPLWQL
jgi:hypothetical protein